MKAFFFLLMLANLLLLPLLERVRHADTEPERLTRQHHPERLTLLGTETPPAVAAAPIAAAAVCVDVGEFDARSAGRFEAQLSRLALDALPAKRLVRKPPQHIVYLPPQASSAAAVRRLAQLRELGFADSAVIRDEPSRRWAISLGLFSRRELAEAQQEKLRAAGVSDARVDEYPVNSARYAYRLTGIDADGRQQLEALASGFAGVALASCE